MDIVECHGFLLSVEQLVQTVIVVHSFVPSLCGCQIVVALNLSFWGLAEFRGLEILEGSGGLFLLSLSLEGNGLVDIESGYLFVYIFLVGIWTLLVFVDHLSEILYPPHRSLIVFGVVTEICDVYQSCDGVLICRLGMVLLYVLLMFLECTVKTVTGIAFCLAGSRLTAADIYQQVHVVAGGVALQFLESFCCRLTYLQCPLVVASHAEQVSHSRGCHGVYLQVFGFGGALTGLECCLPVELGHAVHLQPVAGIASPVVCLSLRQTAVLLQTVGQCQQLVVVSLLVGRLYSALCVLTLFLGGTAATGCHQHRRHDENYPDS